MPQKPINHAGLKNEMNHKYAGFKISEIFTDPQGEVHTTAQYDLPASIIEEIETRIKQDRQRIKTVIAQMIKNGSHLPALKVSDVIIQSLFTTGGTLNNGHREHIEAMLNEAEAADSEAPYIQKQDRLNTAIEKVNAKLQEFKTEAAKIEGQWTEADNERFKNWNNYHDLKDRLESRLKDNYSNYQAWHFSKFGWCAY